ncbi:carboxylesterase/lipase family protein [Streptomyces sp. NBC_00102]|uniref:carboxylesterase/lipase family protein n=1 Tax=Streptomyces sp. NBC_00102 TaxID=2975652 RepID=UPI0022571137|nr:carboxylesterase family protein [Streptomyces sp. NBC_00102]MCX5402237.1 carboxylesterase family protein [Streptomyces sp. NBC_00102]
MDVFTTKSGAVHGRPAERDPRVTAVLGIPYAAPPFGPRRFREPGPVPAWDGVRPCLSFGPVAPQSAELPGAPGWKPGDEDILTVNVWTPGEPGEALPVLVWIHGGAFAFGSSAQPDFDGAALAGLGLVVVSCNYRLGFEGFGHVPDGSGSGDVREVCPDNRGLLDQIAALEWVRDNIAAFGGDADRVTVAGQSAGATSVACLMAVERARGLFRRAALHSAVNSCATAESAARTTREVAGAAGIPATREALLAAPPEVLVAASDAVVEACRRNPESGRRHHDPAIFGPVVDGALLSADPLTAASTGATRSGVELLVCRTTEEYTLFEAVGSSADIGTEDRLDVFARDFGLPAALVRGYRDRTADTSVRETYLAIQGDLCFAEYGDRLAEAHARAGGTAFLAHFDRRSGGFPARPVRAWHCADVPFAFGTLDDENVHFLVGGPPGEADRELSARMMRSWAEFAASGDPGWGRLGAGGAPDTHHWRTREEPGGQGPSPERDSYAGGLRALWREAGLPLLTP